MVARCRVGCCCCIDENIIEPLSVGPLTVREQLVDEERLPEGQIVSQTDASADVIDANAHAQGWFTAYNCF